MIGLEDIQNDRAALGVLNLPMLVATYAGGVGLGATRNRLGPAPPEREPAIG
jgi:hypothetical protein